MVVRKKQHSIQGTSQIVNNGTERAPSYKYLG